MTVRNVPLGQLYLEHDGFKNPRTYTGLDDASMKEFCNDLKENGLLIRPEVLRAKADTPDGFVTVVWDGQRRVLAATKSFGPDHEIEVIDLGPKIYDLSDPKVIDEIEDRAIAVAKERKELSSFELVEYALRKRERSKKLADIATAIGRSESWVSKFLKAYDAATPVLRQKWQTGQITDEQFKDLAAEKEGQNEKAEKLAELRQSGNKAEARAVAKEMAETAKEKRARIKQEAAERQAAEREAKAKAREDAKVAKATAKAKGKGKQEQMKLLEAPKPEAKKAPAEKPEPKKPSAPSKVVLEEIVELASKRKPTHDYVKGVIDGVAYALGKIEAFGRPWHAYVSRLSGVANVKKAKAAKPRRIPKAKQVTVAKARKAKPTGKRKR